MMTYLCFADDMILFGEATGDQLNVMMECLGAFCKNSGKKVNHDKSSIFFFFPTL